MADYGDGRIDPVAQTGVTTRSAGDEEKAARLLADRDDVEVLRARAHIGDEEAAWRLADLLARRGDVEGLRARAAAGDEEADRQAEPTGGES